MQEFAGIITANNVTVTGIVTSDSLVIMRLRQLLVVEIVQQEKSLRLTLIVGTALTII